MLLGADKYYKCPSCGNILKTRNLISGNTGGATFYSDGRCDAIMLPDIPNLTKCKNCRAMFWLSDLNELKETSFAIQADEAEHLELNELWHFLENMPEKHELLVRQRIWWKYNVRKFKSINEIDDWRQNCLDLLDMLNINNNEHRLLAAELNRNLCNFSDCMELIKGLPEQYNTFKERITDECNNRNPLTVNLSEKPKEIIKENEENNEKADEISNQLAIKIEADEKIATIAMEFYTVFANQMNIYAQYELGKLYLDQRFYDIDEALKWLYYAAFQGHKGAFSEIEDIHQSDDDGKHDGWS